MWAHNIGVKYYQMPCSSLETLAKALYSEQSDERDPDVHHCQASQWAEAATAGQGMALLPSEDWCRCQCCLCRPGLAPKAVNMERQYAKSDTCTEQTMEMMCNMSTRKLVGIPVLSVLLFSLPTTCCPQTSHCKTLGASKHEHE